MKHITDFLGKPVISLYESNIEGYVKNVVFDKTFKKIKYLVIFEDNEFQDEKMLDISKIYSLGENAIIVKNNECISLKQEELLDISNHINCKVYTTNGSFIGIIADIEVDESDYNINDIILTNGQRFKSYDFFTFGQDVFFLQDIQNPVKISSIRKRNKITSNIPQTQNILVTIQNGENNSTENIKTETSATAQSIIENTNTKQSKKYNLDNLTLPQKLITNNSEFLIGRKTTKTIYSSNNEVIVKKNVNINDKIIKQAILFNKLRELTIYSV